MSLEPEHSIWVGMFCVLALPGSTFLDDDVGAFVWSAAQATNAQHFSDRMADAMQKLGLSVFESEHVQEVVNEDELSDSLYELLLEVIRNPALVVCGTWHRFKNHDA